MLHHEAFYDIVFEWEDELCKYFNTCLHYAHDPIIFGRHVFQSLHHRLHVNIETLRLFNKTAFGFEMYAKTRKGFTNSSRLAICIIDFTLNESQLPYFYEAYKNVAYLFISSREAYEFLLKHNPPRRIYHLPLSLPDKYRLTTDTIFDKKYDLVLVGRQNLQLVEWLKEYEAHHSITYVYRSKADLKKKEFLYFTNKGELVGNVVTRDDYFKLLRQCKTAFYSTPGMDGDPKSITNSGFSQVTPRFLELLSCGCLLMGCYPNNPDTQYYELGNYVKNVTSYEEFERSFDELLKKKVDVKAYSDYLNQHYTSAVAKQLSEFMFKKS